MKTPKRPTTLMAVAQLICWLAIPLTLLFALPQIVELGSYVLRIDDVMTHDNTLFVILFSAAICLRDLVLGACLIFVEAEAIRICGRMKNASAFSPLNVAGLGRITIALFIAGVITLFFGDSIVSSLLTGLPPIHPTVQSLLLPFTLLTLALMVRAVQVLMRRAVDMQEETDLTI